jgi:3-hydroxyacyl-CoA dehydrogenase
VGLHFFSPANVMRLVEIVCATKSAPTTIRTAFDMCKQIGKVGVAVGVCYGFVGNRMLEPYGREANRLLLEGATVAQVDGVLTKFGMSMGPLAVFDLAGIDIGASMRLENKASFAHDPSYYRVSDVLAERGDKGQKTGRGFYVYQGREKSPNPDLHELIEHESKALGIQRRSISDQEVLDRCLYSLIDEGLRILDDKIAQRPGDIDVIWCNGYGFPSWRGGPMWWADEISPKAIFHNLLGYRRSLGAYGQMWFQPSRSLELLAQSDRKIADLFPNG